MSNPMSLEGQNIIVTGAGQGIGEAVARLSVDLGAKVVLVDLQAEKVNALAEALADAARSARLITVLRSPALWVSL